MTNQTNSKNFIVNNGVILGVASVILSLVMYATGNYLNPHWINSVASIMLFIGLIVLGTKQFKEANNGLLTWQQGVKIGVGIAIIAGLIVVIYNYIFMTVIEPDFIEKVTAIQNEKMLEQGLSEKQIEAANEMGKKFQSPLIMSSLGIISYAIGGFIVAAITAAILKKTTEEQY